jgi:hypothetical protein
LLHKEIKSPLLFFIAICCLGCGERQDFFEARVGENTLRIALERVSDTLNIIRVKTLKDGKLMHAAAYPLPYPVYRFDVGDVTGNGIPDIAVGVVKTTRFDPKLAKRPFLFKITDEGEVRKLWMGSRVSLPLEDFAISKNAVPAKVLTIEKEQSGKFLVAIYRYHGFGLEHNGYVKREISKEEAYKLLQRSTL